MRKLGREMPTEEKAEMIRSAGLPCRMAAIIPRGTPTRVAKPTATSVCCRVGII